MPQDIRCVEHRAGLSAAKVLSAHEGLSSPVLPAGWSQERLLSCALKAVPTWVPSIPVPQFLPHTPHTRFLLTFSPSPPSTSTVWLPRTSRTLKKEAQSYSLGWSWGESSPTAHGGPGLARMGDGTSSVACALLEVDM